MLGPQSLRLFSRQGFEGGFLHRIWVASVIVGLIHGAIYSRFRQSLGIICVLTRALSYDPTGNSR